MSLPILPVVVSNDNPVSFFVFVFENVETNRAFVVHVHAALGLNTSLNFFFCLLIMDVGLSGHVLGSAQPFFARIHSLYYSR